MRAIPFIVCMLLSSLTIYAKPGNINGKVNDKDGKPIDAANVVLLKTDNKTLVKADLSTENGTFVFDNMPDGEYILKITVPGYEVYSSEVITVQGGNISLPDVKLTAKAGSLKEVTVRTQKPLIEIKADKLVVNVENSIINAGSSVLDVIGRSPGVRVDQNDNISLKGKSGVEVMIDGKRTVLSGSDLSNMLKAMPSATVDQIEIISNPSSRYDAAGTAGIINIKTKRDKRLGFNGTANASYAQGVYPKMNGGISLNYRDKKWLLTGSYNYAYKRGFNHLFLYRSFYDNNVFKNAYDQDNNTVFDIYSHVASLGADYTISKKTTVGVMLNTSPLNFEINRRSYSRVLDSNKGLQSYFITDNIAHNSNYNYSVNANLRHTFDSTGKQLSVDADYSNYHARRPQDFVTRYIDRTGSDYLPRYLLAGDLDAWTTIRSVKADYVHPVSQTLRLEAGLKSSYVTQDINAGFFDYSTGTYIYDSTKSNHFIYKENINAAYVNANKDWTAWSVQLGLRVEQTVAKGVQKVYNQTFDRNYAQLFPSFAVQRHVNANNDLGLTLSRRINRPNYEQLNPFKNYLDPSTYSSGYPYLMPELTYNIEASHTFKQRFITSFMFSYLKDPITEVIQPSDDTTQKRVTVQTNKNLTSQLFYDLSGAYQLQYFKWWSGSINFNCYYSIFRGNIANSNLNTGRLTADINVANSFLLPKNWSAELSFFYQTSQLHGYMVIDPIWSLNAGVQKHLFDKKLTVKLNCSDIFWRSYPHATSVYKDYVERFTAQRETRQLSLSVVYRFGKRTVAPVQRRRGGAEDEKRRAGSGNA